MVTETEDVLSALAPIRERGVDTPIEEPETPSAPEREPADDERSRIIGLLGPVPCSIDDLVRLSRSSPATVRVVLLELELAGRIERHGGGMVSLV